MTTATAIKRQTKQQPVDPEVEARNAALLALAHEQRLALRAEAQGIIEGLAAGLSRYIEQGWKWDPEYMAGDPSTWRRIGKLALLFAQLNAIQHTLDWQASTRPLAPLWCRDCDGEYPGAPYLNNPCVEHDATPATAANIALALWGDK